TLRLKDHCKLYDPVPIEEIPKFISQCDLAVLPFPPFIGWRVSSPIKLFEYLAMGKCVVVTEIEAFTDVIGKQPFAFYSSGDKYSDLKQAIKEAYRHREHFNEYGKLAREYALKNSTWKIQAERLVQFFERIKNV
ncbi:MAG: glycosyltransferase, partial [Candidatus Lokiarchaeota archaeon]|nr:glycosyltransferase [Candidatus Lokiarchaeota archaeon]